VLDSLLAAVRRGTTFTSVDVRSVSKLGKFCWARHSLSNKQTIANSLPSQKWASTIYAMAK